MKPTEPDTEAPEAPTPAPAESAEGLQERVQQAQAAAEEQRNAHLRAAAELENVRRRAAREVENARQFGVERLANGLLPVLDSLELGLSNADRADAATLAEGQRATLKLLSKALEAAGITEVNPQGQPFDPALHEAMAVQPAADADPDSVLIVVQKGYVLNGRLLRPARVIVARSLSES